MRSMWEGTYAVPLRLLRLLQHGQVPSCGRCRYRRCRGVPSCIVAIAPWLLQREGLAYCFHGSGRGYRGRLWRRQWWRQGRRGRSCGLALSLSHPCL